MGEVTKGSVTIGGRVLQSSDECRKLSVEDIQGKKVVLFDGVCELMFVQSANGTWCATMYFSGTRTKLDNPITSDDMMYRIKSFESIIGKD